MPRPVNCPSAWARGSMVSARLLRSGRRTWSFVVSLGLAVTLALCQHSLVLHEEVANFWGIGGGGLEHSHPKLAWLRQTWCSF